MVSANLDLDIMGTWTSMQNIIPEKESKKQFSFFRKLFIMAFNTGIEYMNDECLKILQNEVVSGDEKSIANWTEFSKNLIHIIDFLEGIDEKDHQINLDQLNQCNRLVNRVIGKMKVDYFKTTKQQAYNSEQEILQNISRTDYSFLLKAL
jgi:hypothetical protein